MSPCNSTLWRAATYRASHTRQHVLWTSRWPIGRLDIDGEASAGE
jgi:hypothetical protein